MTDETIKPAKAEAAQDIEAFLDDMFAPPKPPAVEQQQAVTNLLQEAPAPEVVKPKSPEEVISLVTEAYTAVTPEQFVASAERQIKEVPVFESRRAREVIGETLDKYCLATTNCYNTPSRTDGTARSEQYWQIRDGFEIPAKEALGRFESRLVAEAECVGVAGSRLRTLADMQASETGFATILTSKVPNLTTLDVEPLDAESRQTIIETVRQQTVEDLAALAVRVLEDRSLQSAGLMLALMPEVRDIPTVRTALQSLVAEYRGQPDAGTNDNSVFQRFGRTSKRVLEALQGDGLAMGSVVVRSRVQDGKAFMLLESNDQWDSSKGIEREVVYEAGVLEQEFRSQVRNYNGNTRYVQYAEQRNATTLGLAWDCSGSDKGAVSKVAPRNIWR